MRHGIWALTAILCAALQTGAARAESVQAAAPGPNRAVLWLTLVNVRTFEVGAGGQREVAGSSCRIQSRYFEQTVQSPARVRVPIYRAGRETLRVTCTLNDRTAQDEQVCFYSAGEPRARFTVSVSSCNNPTLTARFAAM